MPWTGIAVGAALLLPGLVALIYPDHEDDEASTPLVRKILGIGLLVAGGAIWLFTASTLF